jgi:hypothetical protein
MLSHRTTRTGLLVALFAALLTAGSAAAHQPKGGTAKAVGGAGLVGGKPIVFPLLGRARYFDDFGDSRANGGHEGNDILGDWRAPVVAAEDGRVQYWTTSSRAGCMLYLHGSSGTTYLYIHLNNDLTRRRDNRGRCELGTAYAVKDGASVEAGEQIAYNGDSGDAEGTYHLHFEVHPGGGGAVSPFAYLNAAARNLFPSRPGARFSLGLRGGGVAAGNGRLELKVDAVRWWPGGRWIAIDPRVVSVAVPQEAAMDRAILDAVELPERRELQSRQATRLTVVTAPARATAEALRGDPGVLTAARISGS